MHKNPDQAKTNADAMNIERKKKRMPSSPSITHGTTPPLSFETHHFSSSHPGGRQVKRSKASRDQGPTSLEVGGGLDLAGGLGAWKGFASMTVEVPFAATFRAVGKQAWALLRTSLRPMPGLLLAGLGGRASGGGGLLLRAIGRSGLACTGAGVTSGAGGGPMSSVILAGGCCSRSSRTGFCGVFCLADSAGLAARVVGGGVKRTGAPGIRFADVAAEAVVPVSETTLRNGRSGLSAAGLSDRGSVDGGSMAAWSI